MYTPVVIPEEIPGKKEKSDSPKKEEITIVTMEKLWDSLLAEEEDKKNLEPKFRVDVKIEDKPLVLLSWKKNYKAVTNWMRKHMEAYPETSEGFLVKFVDDEKNEWYKVKLCNENESGEEINWKKYKILQCVFGEGKNSVIEDERARSWMKKNHDSVEKEYLNEKKGVDEVRFDNNKIRDGIDFDKYGDKPGSFISREINEAGNLLETREIVIKGVNIRYIVSITEGWEWSVYDCQVVDSFKINDPEIIKNFIDTVVFSYPDLVKLRKTIHKEWDERMQEVRESFFWEWLAHNWLYDIFMFWDTSKEMSNERFLNIPLYKQLFELRESTRSVDLDDESIIRQKLYKLMWRAQLKKRKRKGKK